MKTLNIFLILSLFLLVGMACNTPSKDNTFEKTNSLQLGKIDTIEDLGTGFVFCQVTVGGLSTSLYGLGLASDSLKVGTLVKVFHIGTGAWEEYLVRKR